MPNWKKVVVSGSDAVLNSLNVTTSLTASGLIYPAADGTDGQVLKTDGVGNLFFENTTTTTISIKNVSGGTIAKGTPCYITGSGTSGNVAGVWPADASNPLRMPAGVIAGETLNNGDEGIGLINGFINGVNTSAFAAGDSVYVAVGGGYTNVRPTGSTVLVQKLGNVEKSATNGSGVINGPGYYNDLPNVQQGYTWVGNADGVATAIATSSIQNVVSALYAATASYVNPLIQDVLITGSLLLTGSTNVIGSLLIKENSTNEVINSTTRTLKGAGGTPSVDWDNKDLYDTSQQVSLDWEQKTLEDGGTVNLNWSVRETYDNAAAVSINWNDRTLFDDSGIIPSVNWNGRSLYDAVGDSVLDWQIRQFNGTASLANTASYVNPLVQNVIITGSLTVSGSQNITGNTNISGSLFITNDLIVLGSSSITGSINISSSLTASAITITAQPALSYTSRQILMRNSASGQIEITDSTSPAIYNFGMSYAMITFNYLT